MSKIWQFLAAAVAGIKELFIQATSSDYVGYYGYRLIKRLKKIKHRKMCDPKKI